MELTPEQLAQRLFLLRHEATSLTSRLRALAEHLQTAPSPLFREIGGHVAQVQSETHNISEGLGSLIIKARGGVKDSLNPQGEARSYHLYYPGRDDAPDLGAGMWVAEGKYTTLPCGHIESVRMIRPGRNKCLCEREYIAVPA